MPHWPRNLSACSQWHVLRVSRSWCCGARVTVRDPWVAAAEDEGRGSPVQERAAGEAPPMCVAVACLIAKERDDLLLSHGGRQGICCIHDER
eukprot:5169420-Prymnesium_polylepis.4